MFGVFFNLLIFVTAAWTALRLGLHGDELAEQYLEESQDPGTPWWAKPNGPFPTSDNQELWNFIGAIAAGLIAIVSLGLATASLVDVLR